MLGNVGSGARPILHPALLLLALASTGLAAYGEARTPTRFLRVELLDVGAMALPVAVHFRALRLDCEFNRWRMGVSAIDNGMVLGNGDPGFNMFGGVAAVDAGYLLYRQARPTAFFYGMVPSVWAEVAGNVPIQQLAHGLTARADCRVEADYYGLGLGAEAGVITGETGMDGRFVRPYLRLGLIFGVASFRL
jgi:hypothetical protein